MNLVDYLGRLWHYKWIVLGITVLAAGASLGTLAFLPRHYLATATLEVGAVHNLLGTPGTLVNAQSSGAPSSILPITQTYLNILQTADVKEEARQKLDTLVAQNDTTNATIDGNGGGTSTQKASLAAFNYTSRAQFVRGTGTDEIFIDVTSDDAETARAAANTLSTVLVERSKTLGNDEADDLEKSIQVLEVDPIDKRVAEIYDQTEKTRVDAGLDQLQKNVKIATLNDELKTLQDKRKQYTDIISRINVNQALSENNVSIMSAAMLPQSKQAPPFAKTGMVSTLVGLFIGISGVAIFDIRRSGKPSTLF